MQITAQDWINFRDKLSAISKAAANSMTEFIEKNGGYLNANIDDILAYGAALAKTYGEGTGTLAAMMYDAIAELSNAVVEPAEVAQTATYGEVAKAVQGAAKMSTESEYIGMVIGRLVKMVGADTMLQNAIRDHAQYAWIPAGKTCAFCITLASRGWRTATPASLKGGHAEHIHNNCDCAYAVRFNEETTVEGYDDGKKYLSMYENAPLTKWNTKDGNPPLGRERAERPSSRNRINAMRREMYAKEKEGK